MGEGEGEGLGGHVDSEHTDRDTQIVHMLEVS